jgi:hypothetical protein
MIFENVFFTEMLLPFVLVFVLVFAILQKTEILGKGKAQIDAIVGMVVGLILITFGYQTGVIVSLMGWLAVGISVIFVFLILYGLVAGDLSADKMPAGLRIGIGVLAGIFTLGAVLYVTGFGDKIWSSFGTSGDVWMNIVMIVVILGVVGVAVWGGKKE